jgi:hypothetical protein
MTAASRATFEPAVFLIRIEASPLERSSSVVLDQVTRSTWSQRQPVPHEMMVPACLTDWPALPSYGSTVLLLDLGRFFSFLILYAVGRTPLTGDQPVSRPLPTHRTTQTQNKRTQTHMPQVGYELTIPAFERAKTADALDRAATSASLYEVKTLKTLVYILTHIINIFEGTPIM